MKRPGNLHAAVPLTLEDEGHIGVLGIGLLCIFMAVFLFLLRDREKACSPPTRAVSFARTLTHRASSSTSQPRTPSAARQGPPSRQESSLSTSSSDRIPASRSTSVRTVQWSTGTRHLEDPAGPQASTAQPTSFRGPVEKTSRWHDTKPEMCRAPSDGKGRASAPWDVSTERCERWGCGQTSRNLISEQQLPDAPTQLRTLQEEHDAPLTQLRALQEEHAAQLRAVKVEQEAMRKELLLRVSVLERMIMSHDAYNLSPCCGPKDPGPIPPLEPSTPHASLRPSGLSPGTSFASHRPASNKGKKPSSGTLFYSQVVNHAVNRDKNYRVAIDRAMRERAASLPHLPPELASI